MAKRVTPPRVSRQIKNVVTLKDASSPRQYQSEYSLAKVGNRVTVEVPCGDEVVFDYTDLVKAVELLGEKVKVG